MTSPAELFAAVGATQAGSVPWTASVPLNASGAYIVSIHMDPSASAGMPNAPIAVPAIEAWMAQVPGLLLSGTRPQPEVLARHMARWWLPDTSILYIGKATNLRKRTSQYRRTVLGRSSPHHGGHWIKTLSILPLTYIHFAESNGWSTCGDLEDDLLAAFIERQSTVPDDHPEPILPMPWANLSADRPAPRRRRVHGINPSSV